MTHIEALTYALILALGVVAWAAWFTKTCRCGKCAFHVNEARMGHLRRAEEAHDREHQGFGVGMRDQAHKPDLYHCRDKACPRNPRDVE